MKEESNSPWDQFDQVAGLVRDAFAAVGIVCTLAFVVGYFWGKL